MIRSGSTSSTKSDGAFWTNQFVFSSIRIIDHNRNVRPSTELFTTKSSQGIWFAVFLLSSHMTDKCIHIQTENTVDISRFEQRFDFLPFDLIRTPDFTVHTL